MNRPRIASFLQHVFASVIILSPVEAQVTTRASVSSTGVQGNADSLYSAISGDGRFVTFLSLAGNLVPGDTQGYTDVFVHDRQTWQTTRVNVSSIGAEANRGAALDVPAISYDGRYVAFVSRASNLVAGDTNDMQDIFVHDRQTGQTTRVSVSSAGAQGSHGSCYAMISGDGRFVAFSSNAPNLVAGDTNSKLDVFVHDRQTASTSRVSVDSDGLQGNSTSYVTGISADGRHVLFMSYASNLVPGDTNGAPDAFVHDRQTGETTRVSVDSAGAQAKTGAGADSITADGRLVTFASGDMNLVPGDTNGSADVFVHDRQTGQTTRVSLDSAGGQANDASYYSKISAGGRYVAFASRATNLAPGDLNGSDDIFVHDRLTGLTAMLSVDSAGIQGNSYCAGPALSADGRVVVFDGDATNLVPGDTNGAKDIFVHDRHAELTLASSGTCPGGMAFTVTGATPGATVSFVWGTAGGFTIPPGWPCAGTRLELVPTLLPYPGYVSAVADAAGVASVSATVSPSACGRLLLQAVEQMSCLTSNTEPL